MKAKTRLLGTMECLEDRSLPATFGIPWADAGHLTLSFAPDGTPTLLGDNSLAATMSQAGSSAQWQREILRAFQTWAVNANINIGLIADGGQAFNTPGAVQGDTRFGDIRVGAGPRGSDEIAFAAPFSWTGTTLSGDVIFDQGSPYAIGNVADALDLYSVALHEAGHVFGVGHSDAAGSAMNEDYQFHTGLSAGDVAALQTLYGARTPDAFDAARSNDTRSTASTLPGRLGGAGIRYTADGDITTTGDTDYYKFTVAPLMTGVAVRLQAKGLSLLTPEVKVFDAAGRVVAAAASTDPLSNDVTLRFNAPLLGGTYTVRVDGATSDVFGMGAYRLTVDTGLLGSVLPILDPLLAPVVDGVVNNTLFTATTLIGLSSPAPDARFDAVYRGSIEYRNDVDNYKVRAPQTSPGGPTNLDVMVWGLDANPLDPRIHIYDQNGNPVAFQVLANDSGVMSAQLANVTPGATYYIQVAGRDPGGSHATGAYTIGADFNQFSPTTPTWAGGGDFSTAATSSATLNVAAGGLVQFFLAPGSAPAGGTAGVTMTVTDSAGNVVLTLDATAAQPVATAVGYLDAGSYSVVYTSRTSGGAPPTTFDLFLLSLSDNMGPYSPGTTSPSSGTTTTTSSSGSTTTTSSSGSTSSGSTYSGYTYSGASTATARSTYYTY
jgi:hypothetical protein